MKKIAILFAIFCSFLNATEHNTTNYDSITTTSTVISGEFLGQCWNPLPESIVKRIKGKSWNSDCPIPLEDLAYVQVSHWNYNNEIVTGELIYHKTLALEIIEIFQELFEAKFPIEKMVLIDDYNANDELSMEDNNSSAFCSRAITGKPGVFSKHSYGSTIDINPLINPYVRGSTVLPKGSEPYLDRTLDIPGLIKEGDVCYQAFIKRGYTWGGHWSSLKDYQHFEKDITK
ncbi:MAG: hypothetical protein COT84_03175 [Chlamydiae bacterium CG10_big_fil_rev_8_21_14_0_10_35_9]|nr:MAG: hypothetical protein COT84_03175 [Chlamydiae bacterium CG10_big_fil_rev_8_21_14_0_10_35_9]